MAQLSPSFASFTFLIFVDIEDMMEKWDILRIVKDLTSSPKYQAELHLKIKDEMQKEMERSKVLKEKNYSKQARSSKMSIEIGENYRMMESLQKATKNGK